MQQRLSADVGKLSGKAIAVGLDQWRSAPDTNVGDHAGWHVTFGHVFHGRRTKRAAARALKYVDGIENSL